MTEQTDTSIVIDDVLDATPARLFELLADPANHQDIDGSGMVRAAPGSTPVTEVGQSFVMDMHLPGREYQMENHVTAFEADRLIEWKPARVGSEPVGMLWRWELEAVGEDKTRVVHTYDWSAVTDPAVLERVTFPRVPAADLERSVRRLGTLA
jgi:uncharacterized protein YndB with AHSA1/START domain